MPRSGGNGQAAGFGGPLAAVLRRRAMPAAVGAWALGGAGLVGLRPARGVLLACARSRRLRRSQQLLALGASLVVAILLAPAAHAEEVYTGQAAAANATDATWIAAPVQRAAVCIVDTGSDVNADTTNVIARLAIDDGDPGDTDTEGHHGTLMSMIASAPYNGFGMVGAAPSVNVVSVRAQRPGAGGFFFSDVLKGIADCSKWRATYNIKVISLSLGVQGTLDPTTQATLNTKIDGARALGMSVVAAAGNHPGAVDQPAAYAPVFAVGASDTSGARCAFAASGPQVDLWAPGCPQDVALPDGRAAWAAGSSESTAFVAGILAQLRGLDPALGPDQAEALLTANARTRSAGRTLDVASAFTAAGLAVQLAQGHTADPGFRAPGDPAATSSSSTTATADAGAPTASDQRDPIVVTVPGVAVAPAPLAVDRRRSTGPSKPRVRSVLCRRGLLTIAFKGKPANVRARVEIYAREKGREFPGVTRSLVVRGDRLRTRVSGKPSQVSITYVDPFGAASAPLSIHP